MFLKNFDYLSYPLTFFFNNYSSHPSIISGIITIIIFIICIILTLYLSLDFLFKRNPNSYTYNRVIYDVGSFPLNESSMFHYVYFYPVSNLISEGYFEIIGITNKYVNEYNNDGNRSNFDHWIYKPCINIKIKEQKILNLINHELYNISLCISSFYNSTSNTFLSINDSNFGYPTLAHGISHPNGTYYAIFFQKCINSTLNKNNCKSEEEINNFISKHTSIAINLINQEIEVLNYKSPIVSSLYSLNSGFSDGFTANHLNFQPLYIKTHDRLFLSNKGKEEISYIFEQNEVQEWKTEVGIKGCIYFWMQNKAIIYERYYKRLENVLADAGGIIKSIITFGTWINHFFAKYVTYKDINLIIRKYIDINENVRSTHLITLKNKAAIYTRLNKNLNASQYSNMSLFKKNNVSIENLNDNSNENNVSNFINNKNFNLNSNCKNYLQSRFNNSNSNLKNNNSKNKKKKKHINIVLHSPTSINFRVLKNSNSISDKRRFNFYDYFLFIIDSYKCKKKKRNNKKINYLSIIEKYYQKIISEEEMFYLAYEINSLKNYVDRKKNKYKKINTFSAKNVDEFSNIFQLN